MLDIASQRRWNTGLATRLAEATDEALVEIRRAHERTRERLLFSRASLRSDAVLADVRDVRDVRIVPRPTSTA